MLKNEIDTYRLFVIELILIDGGVIAVFVGIWCHGMAYADIVPTQALLDKCPMLFRESSRPQAEIFAYEAYLFNAPFFVRDRGPQWNPSGC